MRDQSIRSKKSNRETWLLPLVVGMLIIAFAGWAWWYIRDTGDSRRSRNAGSQVASGTLPRGEVNVSELGVSSSGVGLPDLPGSFDHLTREAPVYPELVPSSYSTVNSARGHQPEVDGEVATAFVAVPSTGKKLRLAQNQMGEFPMVEIVPSETVDVHVVFPMAEVGSRYAIVAQDGGIIAEAARPGYAKVLDSKRTLHFQYTCSANTGMHRVVLRSESGESKILEFWAGGTLPVMKSAADVAQWRKSGDR
jgi:hypothetical protein